MNEHDKALDGLRIDTAMKRLDESLGRGEWLEPDDYEALKIVHNRLAQAAEDVIKIYDYIIGKVS